jgi:cysteine synthase A
MRQARSESFLRAYETPKIVRLASNLHVACFPLMKLLPARFILDRASFDGRLGEGGDIVETSSGSFGLALAMLAAVRNYRLTLVTASSLMDGSFKRRIEHLGASVIVTKDDKLTGDQSGRLAKLKTILERQPSSFWPRQYDNHDNQLAYGKLAEILSRAVGQIDCLVGCVGSGGSLCGTGRFLRPVFPDMLMAAVDTHCSVLFGHNVGPRMLRGLGNSILPSNLTHTMIDQVHWVGALPAFSAARRLYRQHSLYMGPTSGAAMLVADWLSRLNPDRTTVAILPDEGYRYQDTLYNDAWLATVAGWPCELPDEPLALTDISAGGEGDWTWYNWKRRSLEAVTKTLPSITK